MTFSYKCVCEHDKKSVLHEPLLFHVHMAEDGKRYNARTYIVWYDSRLHIYIFYVREKNFFHQQWLNDDDDCMNKKRQKCYEDIFRLFYFLFFVQHHHHSCMYDMHITRMFHFHLWFEASRMDGKNLFFLFSLWKNKNKSLDGKFSYCDAKMKAMT
jgi:hypothetical protein